MAKGTVRFAGVELYYDDLERAKTFYRDVLGVHLTEESPGAFAKFDSGSAFVCLERKGLDAYPSQDKAVVFLEVDDLRKAIEEIGSGRILQSELDSAKRQPYAVLHDPEGYNVVLLEEQRRKQTR